jgi:hypothetical protein
MKKLLILFLSILIVNFIIFGENATSPINTSCVTLIWNPSTDPNVTGYNVYYGVASRVYTNKLDVGSATNATVKGLRLESTYWFAATAYNLLGVESDYSSEVSVCISNLNWTIPTVKSFRFSLP